MFESHSHPIAQHDDFIIIVVRTPNVRLRWTMDNQGTLAGTALVWKELWRTRETHEEAVRHGITHVRMIPVRTVLIGEGKLISERRTSRNRALRNAGNTVGPIGTILIHAVWMVR